MIEALLPSLGKFVPPIPVLEGTYKKLAPAAVVRSNHNSEYIDGKIYTFGGSYNATLNPGMEVYDIETDVWSNLVAQNTPSPRHGAASCVLDGKIYLFGGSTGAGWGPMTNEAYVFDPVTSVWTKLANCPNSIALHAAVVINGKIYIFGGFNGADPTNALTEYDPVANTYRNIPNAQPVQHGHRAVVINDKMFVVGGVSYSTLLNRCVMYDPSNNTWANYAASPLGNTFTYTGALGENIYMFGGSYNANATNHNRLFKFNLRSNAWAELSPGATTRFFGVAVMSDKAMYLHAGMAGTTLVSELWEIT